MKPRKTMSAYCRGGALAVGFWLGAAGAFAAATVGSKADADYTALQALEAESVAKATGLVNETAEEFMQRNGRALEMHRRGLAFIEENSADPRRWEVVILLRGTPTFLREVEDGGDKRIERDGARQAAWSRRHDDLLEELLAAKDASARAVREALLSLLTRHSKNWRSHIHTEGGMIMLEKMLAWYARYEREFPRSIGMVQAARALAEVLVMEDPERCRLFLAELIALYPSNQAPDPAVREMAEGRLKLLRGLGRPVALALTGLGGEKFDSRDYRGKLLLVAVLSAEWRDEMNFMRSWHAQFRTAGLEIVQVSGTERRRQGAGPDLLTAEGRAQMDKATPWRIVWDKAGTIGEFARSVGINGFPNWMLVARDGTLRAEKASPREVMAVIEAELEAEKRRPANGR